MAVSAFAFPQIHPPPPPPDFAGYRRSREASCFGFELTENFARHVATNPSEFWQQAHQPVHLAPRLSLCPPWQPRGLAVDLSQPGDHDAPRRPLARRGLEVRRLGLVSGHSVDRIGRHAARPSLKASVATGTLTWWLKVVIFFTSCGSVFFRAPTVTQALQMLSSPLHFHFAAPYGTELLVKIWCRSSSSRPCVVGRDTLAPLRSVPAPRALMDVTCFYLLMVYGAYASKEFIYFQF